MRDTGVVGVRRLTILGATGSVGRQAQDVVQAHPDHLKIVGLSVHRNLAAVPQLIARWQPEFFAVSGEADVRSLREAYPDVEFFAGERALPDLAQTAQAGDLLLNAVSGAAGIEATLTALTRGSDVALANKETLVAAGELVLQAASSRGARVLAVDSEHSAIAQCLAGYARSDVRCLWLTASGGPFRGYSRERLAAVTVADALAHPTWKMGKKITVDSATLMNKGLEVIEAHHLFAASFDDIAVLVHPQSVIHSLVEFRDGAFLAQLGTPDMRLPIQHALLGQYGRLPANWDRLDPFALSSLTFERPDLDAFPGLGLAYACGRAGGTVPAVMNAANEVSANAFLAGELRYLDIVSVVSDVVSRHERRSVTALQDVLEADAWARRTAQAVIGQRRRSS